MTRIFPVFLAVIVALFTLAANGARAQSPGDVVWVQIEAQPSRAQATARARIYAGELEDVNGFALGGGWYGIAVGPYRRADAEQVLRAYVRDRIVPRDSFIQLSSSFRQQFWPVGANLLNVTPLAPALQEQADTQVTAQAEPAPAPEPEPEPVPEPEEPPVDAFIPPPPPPPPAPLWRRAGSKAKRILKAALKEATS